MSFKRRDDLLLIYMLDGECNEVYQTLNSFNGNTKIVEWGSGGSTVSWLFNLTSNQTFISIEHDPEWFKKVTKILDEQTDLKDIVDNNFKYYLFPKEGPLGNHVGQFDFDEFAKDYLEGPKDIDIWDANVYFVDGINRLQCALNVFEKAQNRDAIVYLHDYGSNKHAYEPLLTTFPKHEVFTLPISNDWNGMIKLWLK